MHIEYHKEYSSRLGRDMEFKVYGHGGKPALAVPCQNGRFYDWENFGMLETLGDYLENGVLQLFTVDTIDAETVSDQAGDPYRRVRRHEAWYNYVIEELLPRIREINPKFTSLMIRNLARLTDAQLFINHGIERIRSEAVSSENGIDTIRLDRLDPAFPRDFVIYELLSSAYGFKGDVVDALCHVTDWLLREGPSAVWERNARKAERLYAELDRSAFWRPLAPKAERSLTNVTFRLPTAGLEEAFLAQAEEAGLVGLRGHRALGGIRASLYNAMPEAGVEALVCFMRAFERANG